MTNTPNIQAVADGLSIPAKGCLANGHPTSIPTAYEMRRAGCVAWSIHFGDRGIVRLSPLGHAVRQHLQEPSK